MHRNSLALRVVGTSDEGPQMNARRNNTDLHLPPQNLVAERSVLGGLLLQNTMIDEVGDRLTSSHFYSDVHATIYSVIRRLHERSVRVDPVTLAEELQARQQLESIGGPPYIIELLESVPHAAHTGYYADIVRDKWTKRTLVQVCTDVLRECYEGDDDTDQLLELAERRLFGILESSEGVKKTAIGDLLMPTLDRINARIGKQGIVSGLQTGFRDLDTQTNGFHPGELIVLAARPSMGKTALVCNIAEWVAGPGGTTVEIFSLEQSQEELTERFLCINSRLNGHQLRKGQLSEPERFSLLSSARELSPLPLHIDDRAGLTMTQISSVCRRMKRQTDLGLVIVDYLQLIEPEDNRANREQQVAQITRRLKAVAKDCRVPIVALSQLNRGVDLREDKRPRLSDLRESGAIEQDADVVMFLHRPDAYNADDRPGLAELIVAKHRSGPTGIVNLGWRKESMRFTDYEVSTAEF